MYLILLAFNNLKHNVKRTIAMIIIIAVALASIILYKGYVEYSKEGMRLGYTQSSGDFQIALNNYWSNNSKENQLIDDNTLQKILSFLQNDNRVDYIDCVYDFSGIVGNENSSEIFWGKGFDYPEKHYSAKTGFNIFKEDEDSILLGENLAEKIGIKEFSDDKYVTLLTNSSESGINLCSFKVNGLTSSGIAQNDSGLLICSRKGILDAIQLENSATYIQVFLKDNNSKKIIDDINEYCKLYSLDIGIKTWKELNPSFDQVNKLNEYQFYIISLILCILIFISLLQSVSTSLIERLGEFGTLEAIGLNKFKIILMILLEIFYLVICGLILGIFLSLGINNFITTFNIKMTPPGYTEGFTLMFYFTLSNIIKSCIFVIICCFLSVIFPIISIYKNSVKSLINK